MRPRTKLDRAWRGAGLLALAFLLGACAGRGSPAAPRPVLPAVGAPSPTLLDPSGAAVNRPAPQRFKVLFETTQGDFVVEVREQWAPIGAERFYNLVTNGYYDGSRFFRVLPGFVAQFGIHAVPEISAIWRDARIPDDPVATSNVRGTLTFATAGPDTRTTQLFVNLVDNARLDPLGFAPFAMVTGGMDVVERLYGGYGEGAPQGNGPDQGRMQSEGESYLARDFPLLDQILRAQVIVE